MQVKWNGVVARTVRTQGVGWVGLKREAVRTIRTVAGGLRARVGSERLRGRERRTSVRSVRWIGDLVMANIFEQQPKESANASAVFRHCANHL